MRSPAETEIALECLRLAASRSNLSQAGEIIDAAARFYAFASGEERDDASTIADINGSLQSRSEQLEETIGAILAQTSERLAKPD